MPESGLPLNDITASQTRGMYISKMTISPSHLAITVQSRQAETRRANSAPPWPIWSSMVAAILC